MKSEAVSIRHVLLRLFSGSGWFAGSNALQQALGFLQILLVARVLEPRQVGLLAIGWLTINALDVFSRSGAADAVIHLRDDAKSYLSTFFWVEFTRGVLLSLVALLLAPIIVDMFNEPAAYPVISTLALLPLIKALRSPGILLYQRNIQFREWGRFVTISSLTTFVLSSSALLIWKRLDVFVWSLLLGELVASLVSHGFSPFFPKLSFERKRALSMLKYGRWLLGAGIVSYLAIYLDRYVVGSLANAAILGIYTVSAQFGEAFTYRISKVISTAVQPAYASLQNSSAIARLFEINFRLCAILFSIVTAVTWAWLPLLIPTLLGEEWRSAIPIFSIFVVTGFLRALSATGSPYFKGVGQPKKIFTIEIFRSVCLAVTIIPFYLFGGLVGASLAVALTSTLQLMLTLIHLKRDQCVNMQLLIGLLPALGYALGLSLSLRMFYSTQAPGLLYFSLVSLAAVFISGCLILITEHKWLWSIISLVKPVERSPEQ